MRHSRPIISCVSNLLCWHAGIGPLAMLMMLFSTSPRLYGQPSPNLLERFKSEAPKAWQAQQEHIHSLRGTVTIRLSYTGEKPSREIGVIKQSPSRYLREWEISEDPPKEEKTKFLTYSISPDYLFTLKKNKRNDLWVLSDLVLGDQSPWTRDKLPETYAIEAFGPIESVLLRVSRTSLPELVGHEAFKATTASSVARGDETLVKVEFVCPHDLTMQPFLAIQSGWLLLDRSASWCLRDYELQSLYNNATATEKLEEFQLKDTADKRSPAAGALCLYILTENETDAGGKQGNFGAAFSGLRPQTNSRSYGRRVPPSRLWTAGAVGSEEAHCVVLVGCAGWGRVSRFEFNVSILRSPQQGRQREIVLVGVLKAKLD